MSAPFLASLKVLKFSPKGTVIRIEYLSDISNKKTVLLFKEDPKSDDATEIQMESTTEKIQNMQFMKVEIIMDQFFYFKGKSLGLEGSEEIEPGEFHKIQKFKSGRVALEAEEEYLNSIEYVPYIPLNWNPDLEMVSKNFIKEDYSSDFRQFTINVLLFVIKWIYEPNLLLMRLDTLISEFNTRLRAEDSFELDKILRPAGKLMFEILYEILTFDRTEDERLLTGKIEKAQYKEKLKGILENCEKSKFFNPELEITELEEEQDSLNRLAELLKYQ